MSTFCQMFRGMKYPPAHWALLRDKGLYYAVMRLRDFMKHRHGDESLGSKGGGTPPQGRCQSTGQGIA